MSKEPKQTKGNTMQEIIIDLIAQTQTTEAMAETFTIAWEAFDNFTKENTLRTVSGAQRQGRQEIYKALALEATNAWEALGTRLEAEMPLLAAWIESQVAVPGEAFKLTLGYGGRATCLGNATIEQCYRGAWSGGRGASDTGKDGALWEGLSRQVWRALGSPKQLPHGWEALGSHVRAYRAWQPFEGAEGSRVRKWAYK
jgi:hypothetical protein